LTGRIPNRPAANEAHRELASALALLTLAEAEALGLFGQPWPDPARLASPLSLALASGDAPDDRWYTLAGRRLQRASPPARRSQWGGVRDVFLTDSRPSDIQLAKALDCGASVALCWIPLTPSYDPGAPERHPGIRCLSLLRGSGFGPIRLLLLVPVGSEENAYRRGLDLLLADRGPMEVHTFRLAGEAAVGPESEDELRRFRFFAAVFLLTRSAKLPDDSIRVILEDPLFRTHPELLAEIACSTLTPSERVSRLRQRVETLTSRLAPPPPPLSPPSLAHRLKSRARVSLPEPLWGALRRLRRSVFPPKES